MKRNYFLLFFSASEESLLSASHPLQNDPNQDSTEAKDANDQVNWAFCLLCLNDSLSCHSIFISVSCSPLFLQDLLTDEEKLAESALNLKHVGDASVPVILNIIGNFIAPLLHTVAGLVGSSLVLLFSSVHN